MKQGDLLVDFVSRRVSNLNSFLVDPMTMIKLMSLLRSNIKLKSRLNLDVFRFCLNPDILKTYLLVKKVRKI